MGIFSQQLSSEQGQLVVLARHLNGSWSTYERLWCQNPSS